MNGAETLVRTLLASGVNTCFANPGTSEMHFVAALDRVPGMHCVLCLFEGVATGAADGYGRMAEKPAITLLHGGPGLGNGLANLHNARRAQTPVLNVVGDQATHHRPLDPPLTADTEGWARGFRRGRAWCSRSRPSAPTPPPPCRRRDRAWPDRDVDRAGRHLLGRRRHRRHAIAGAAGRPGRAACHPADRAGSSQRRAGRADPRRLADPRDDGRRRTAHRGRDRREAHRGAVQRAGGARPRTPSDPAPALRHRPGDGGDGRRAAHRADRHQPPVAPFAYPDKPGYLAPEAATTHVLARPEQDVADALARLADELGAPDVPAPEHKRVDLPTKAAITPENITQMLAALLPENAVVDRRERFVRPQLLQRLVRRRAARLAADHRRRDRLGLPMATGAAIAAPGRRVVALQADGSAMYTLQACGRRRASGCRSPRCSSPTASIRSCSAS